MNKDLHPDLKDHPAIPQEAVTDVTQIRNIVHERNQQAARIAELEAENNNLRDDLLATASYLCKELSKNGIGNHSGNFINCAGGICVSTRALLSPKAGA